MNNNMSSLSPHIFKHYTFSNGVTVEQYDANSLLINPYRFDIVAKYLYIRYKDRNLKTKWGENIYKEHIKAFNNFFEDDGSGKTSEYEFINAFDRLINSCYEKDAFKDPFLIPLDEKNCPIDGSHRLALSAYHNKAINVVRMKRIEPNNSYIFDYKFFINKGLEEKYADFIALEYVKINPKTYLLCVFPRVQELPSSFEHLIYQYADIYYKKDVYLTNTGRLNTILSLYKDEPWLGNSTNGFTGAKHKVDMCFNSSLKPLQVYLMTTDSTQKLAQLKLRLRKLLGRGKHSLHINDFHEETFRLAMLFFNENSINHINNVPSEKSYKFISYLSSFNDWLTKQSFDRDNFCISGSAVLSAFGLRDCYDLDFLAADRVAEKACDVSMISCHNNHFMKYPFGKFMSIDDLIFNPENHFYFYEFKFLSLEILKRFKITRNESKDIEDISLINYFYNDLYISQKRLKYPIKEYPVDSRVSRKDVFVNQIDIFRSYARIKWYKTVTEDGRYIHPKIPVLLPDYLLDRYSFRLYLHSAIDDSTKTVCIPDYDIFAAYHNWYTWISENFLGLPNYNYLPPSLNAKIVRSDFRSSLFHKWREFIKSFDIDIREGCYQDPINLYWFEYFQNSCLFPRRPAMWGPTYFYKLSLNQQKFLIDSYGVQGIMDFFIFMQQVHEESHIQQRGEPMLSEFIHAWLWCKFISEIGLDVFQINDETLFSCNIERKWVMSVDFTRLEVKELFQDTYVGSMNYFNSENAYENACVTAFLFDHGLINYKKYLNMILDIFLNKNASRWHKNCFLEKLYTVKSFLQSND